MITERHWPHPSMPLPHVLTMLALVMPGLVPGIHVLF